MLVSSVMTRKVTTVLPSKSFHDLIKILVKRKISGVPVVGKNGKLVGIISEKDLFFRIFPSQSNFYQNPEYLMNFDNVEHDAHGIEKLKAKDIMTKKVITISEEDHVLKACSLFIMHGIRRLPVVKKGKVIGIVTTNDIYKKYLTNVF